MNAIYRLVGALSLSVVMLLPSFASAQRHGFHGRFVGPVIVAPGFVGPVYGEPGYVGVGYGRGERGGWGHGGRGGVGHGGGHGGGRGGHR